MVTQTTDGKILFQFYRPGARQMTIAGDFNGWQQTFHMVRGRDGWWRSQIELAPGTYRFRYLADGEWYTDFAAFGVEPGPFGWNSVLKVDPAASQATPVPPAFVSPSVMAETASPVPEPVRAPVRFVPNLGDGSSPPPERRVRRRPAFTG